MDARILGPLGFVVGWFAIIFMLAFWGADKSKSISYHSARHKKVFITYGVLATISLILFFAFCIGWLGPHYNLPIIFSCFCGITILGFGMATWVPVTGKRGKLHDKLAGIATISMVPILLIIATATQIPGYARLVNLLCLVLLGLLLIAFKVTRGYHLLIQVSYFLVFDLALVATAFL